MPPSLTARQPRPASRQAGTPPNSFRPRPVNTPSSSARTVDQKPKTQSTAKPNSKKNALRVAIVCDWLSGGGAELVVEQLHAMFPDAPIYASFATREWRQRLNGKVQTGVLQCWPLPALKKFLPVLRIWWFSRLRLRGYDVVISSSGAEAKGVRVPLSTLHITYCHAPTHYYWSRYHEYLQHPGFGICNGVARIGLKALVKPLRRWDYNVAQRPDFMVANSAHTKAEIQKYYERSAVVIHPPVTVERFRARASNTKRRGFVIAGRQTPYKRFDLAVIACTKLNLPLTVIGTGPEHRRLRKLAGKTVTFLGKVSDEVLAEELSSAKAFLFPGVDDFGIIAVEALAAGTPVIAYGAGGAFDYVIPGKTGVLFNEQTPASLARAIREFSRLSFDRAEITRFSERFSRQQFRRSMDTLIRRALQESAQSR